MVKRGDIVVERLTGRRAIVIRVSGPEDEVTCRFGDGRLEERYAFELEPALSLVGSLLSFVLTLFVGQGRERPAPSVSDRVRPLLVRPPGAS
jgi:hypothetical protein